MNPTPIWRIFTAEFQEPGVKLALLNGDVLQTTLESGIDHKSSNLVDDLNKLFFYRYSAPNYQPVGCRLPRTSATGWRPVASQPWAALRDSCNTPNGQAVGLQQVRFVAGEHLWFYFVIYSRCLLNPSNNQDWTLAHCIFPSAAAPLLCMLMFDDAPFDVQYTRWLYPNGIR